MNAPSRECDAQLALVLLMHLLGHIALQLWVRVDVVLLGELWVTGGSVGECEWDLGRGRELARDDVECGRVQPYGREIRLGRHNHQFRVALWSAMIGT